MNKYENVTVQNFGRMTNYVVVTKTKKESDIRKKKVITNSIGDVLSYCKRLSNKVEYFTVYK